MKMRPWKTLWGPKVFEPKSEVWTWSGANVLVRKDKQSLTRTVWPLQYDEETMLSELKNRKGYSKLSAGIFMLVMHRYLRRYMNIWSLQKMSTNMAAPSVNVSSLFVLPLFLTIASLPILMSIGKHVILLDY